MTKERFDTKKKEVLVRFPEETGLTFEEWIDLYWMKRLEFEHDFQKELASKFNLDDIQINLIHDGAFEKYDA